MRLLPKHLAICFLFAFLFSSKAQEGFIQNNGQWNDAIHYQAEFAGGKLFINDDGLYYNLYHLPDIHHFVEEKHQKVKAYHQVDDYKINAHCLHIDFVNASFNQNKVVQQLKNPTYFNYYLGKDQSKWQSRVPAYYQLIYSDIYPNIDYQITQHQHAFKYDLIIHPNGNIENIQIAYHGAKNISLKDGKLHIQTSINTIIEQAPYAYQIVDGEKQEITCQFNLTDDKLSFILIDEYNPKIDIIIDPFIVFSRYSSSSANNFGYTATYDAQGNAFGAGSVFNTGYITTPGAYDISFNGASTDIGITKYTPDGLQRIYATYLGGNDTELPHSIVVNSLDELFVLGTTSSTDYPTSVNSFDSSYNGGSLVNLQQGLGVIYQNGSDFIVSKFSEDGTQLLASTYVGGADNDGLNLSPVLKYNYADEVRGEIIIDENDHCLITSCSYSSDFPTANAFQDTLAGNLDGVVFKMDGNLNTLLWSSYIGGLFDDASYSINIDANENLIIAGGTNSQNFPTLNAFQNTYGGGDADGFISRIHTSGSSLLQSTYYGANDYDQLYFIDNNDVNEIYVFGQTKSSSGLFVNNAAYNQANGGQLITKFQPNIDQVIWSTRFGDQSGIPDISPTAFLVDVCNQVFLSGWGAPNLGGITTLSGTSGLDVTNDAIDPTTDNADFYFMVLRDDASALVYASFFGGASSSEHVDGGTSRFDKKGVIYQAVCAGCGGNQDFPTVPSDSIGIWTNNNSCNLGLVKYAFTPPSVVSDFSLPPLDCVPINLDFTNTSQSAFNDTTASSYIWVIDSDTIIDYHLNYNFVDAGTYQISLIVIDTNSCNFSDTITKTITLLGNSNQVLDTLSTCSNTPIQIGIDPVGGNNTNYQWTPSIGLSNNQIANPLATINQSTSYTLIVSNANCIDTFTQTILVEDIPLQFNYRDSICLGDTVTVNATSIQNAAYNWSPDSLIVSGQGSDEVVFIANSNPFIFECTATSPNNCTSSLSDTITINEFIPEILVSANPDTIVLGDSSQLLASSSSIPQFFWDTSSSLSNLSIEDPIAFPSSTTRYTVSGNDGICPAKAEVTVYVVLPDCIEGQIFVPNAFSPNGDNNNDLFQVRSNVPIDNFYFAVYDRWGQQVFETTDQNSGWDGTFKSDQLSPAAYGWYCSGNCENGDFFFIKGNVTILR